LGKRVILGVGNILLKDEGLGVHVVKMMESMELPEGVELVDGGTLGFDLLGLFEESEKIVIVDALKGGHEPGTIYKVTPEELKGDLNRALSLHQVGLLEVMEMGKLLGFQPQVVIIGIEPKEIDWGMELSEEVKAKLPKVISLVLEEIKSA